MKSVDDVAITADHWTDPLGTQPFLGMMAIYQKDGQLVNRQLACRAVDNKECEYTAHRTDDILQEFGKIA